MISLIRHRISERGCLTELAWVILNGPSRHWARDFNLTGPVIGCNWAYRDWPLTDVVCIDRKMVEQVEREFLGQPFPLTFWTRSWPNIRSDWRQVTAPGIDSGTLAVHIALTLAQQVRVIGADGIMLGSRDTAYDYPWERQPKTQRAQNLHRRAMIKLVNQNPQRISVYWPENDPDIPTLPHIG